MALRYIFTVTLFVLGLVALPHAFGRTSDVTKSNCAGDVEAEHPLTNYAQWVHFTIKYVSPGNLVIRNSKLVWGKWYANGNQGVEIGSPDGTIFNATRNGEVYASGRENSPSGTEGSFEIWEVDGALACRVYWDCPYIGTNSVSVDSGVNFVSGHTEVNKNGAIGLMTVTIVKIPSLSVV